jgi:hypothetical protein
MLGLDLPVPDKTTPAQGSAAADDSTEEAKTTGKRRDRLQRAEDLREWLNEKHGGKPSWSRRQLHLATDPVNSDILTTTNEADASLVSPLLVQIDDLVSTVLAHGAYDGEPTWWTIFDRHPDATMVIPPRSNAALRNTAEIESIQLDRHIEMLARRGGLGWQKAVSYGKHHVLQVQGSD